MTIFFGSHDWMASRTPSDTTMEMNPCIKNRVILNASHHIYLDEPDDLIKSMMQDLAEVPGAAPSMPFDGVSPSKLI